ncbi:MAG: phosphomannomutase/phosphoglucomutase [Rhodothalassiaceae bacterium]
MTDGHRFDPTILREYDIRGIVGQTLDLADAEALGRAYGTRLRQAGGQRVAVGFDGRESSPRLADALIAGLRATGADVRLIGLGPTPMLYYAVHELGTDGGIMVTGSHNPPDYNGFKMMLGHAPLWGDGIAELGRIAASGSYVEGSGALSHVALLEAYVSRLLEGWTPIDLKVGWDPGNGAAGEAVRMLTARLGGEHVVINGEIDGRFPNHHPDPTVEENLAQLKALVRERNLDIGIAFDGDGDRIGAVDGRGRVIWGDQILLILARQLLKDLPGARVIADVKASQLLFDGVREAGGQPEMWKTGHSLIKIRMKETDAPLAGEMSGHIFYRHRFYGHDDALYAALRLLEAIAADGGDLAAIKDRMPVFHNTPELRFPCPETRKKEVVDLVRTRLAARGADVIAVDGVRVNAEGGWWLLRASNTQDVLVARVEAPDPASLDRLKQALLAELEAAGIEPPADL